MNSTSTIPFPKVTSCAPLATFKPEIHESTYGLLIRSEEKSRGILEIIVFGLCILSAVTSIWQFAHQSTTLPASTDYNVTSYSDPTLGCENVTIEG